MQLNTADLDLNVDKSSSATVAPSQSIYWATPPFLMSENQEFSARGTHTCGNPPTDLPSGKAVARASDVQARNSSMTGVSNWGSGGSTLPAMAETGNLGLGGSTLQATEAMDTSNLLLEESMDSIGTLTQSVESLLLLDEPVKGKPGGSKEPLAPQMSGTPSGRKGGSSAVSSASSSIKPTTKTVKPELVQESAGKSVPVVTTVQPGLDRERIGKPTGVCETDGESGLSARQIKRRRKKKAATEGKVLAGPSVVASTPMNASTPLSTTGKRNRSDEKSSEMDTLPELGTGATEPLKKRRVKKRKTLGSSSEAAGPSSTAATTQPVASGSRTSAEARGTDPVRNFSEVAAGVLSIAIQTDSEHGALSKQQADHVEGLVWKAIADSKESPQFEGWRVENGNIIVRCSDLKSREWLIQTVAKMPAFQGARFVSREGHLAKLVRATVLVPGKPREPHELLSMIRKQNPGLETDHWRTYSFTRAGVDPRNGANSLWVLGIDADSLKVLNSKFGLRPHLFLGRVSFNVSKKSVEK